MIARIVTIAMVIGLVFASLLAPRASAAVNFDPATGTGFIGKGDVQSAFGWNNATMQANANAVVFSVRITQSVVLECTRETASQVLVKTFDRTVRVNSSLLFDGRYNRSNTLTGFVLSGYGEDPGVMGAECPTAWTLVSATAGEATISLTVSFGDLSVILI